MMSIRKAAVAGQFYPGIKDELRQEVSAYLRNGGAAERNPSIWGVMLPHAGHIFCGNIIGKTLAGWDVPDSVLILCPNHTGYGRPLGVWPDGEWQTPLGNVAIDQEIAAELIQSGAPFEPDMASHLREHSIEVLLPFLQEIKKDIKIVPVTVGIRNARILEAAGRGLAEALKRHPEAGVIVSSDMNHYEDHNSTLAKDELALQKALSGDAEGLLNVVEKEKISMCGAGPLAIALYAAQKLGRKGVELTGHTTSGPVSRDFNHTVGYAGLHLLAN